MLYSRTRTALGPAAVTAKRGKRRCFLGCRNSHVVGREPQAAVDEFTLLEFRHLCGRDRRGRFAVIRLPDTKHLRRFKQRVKEWLRACRHWRVPEQQEHLGRMLQGFYQCYAIPYSLRKLQLLVTDVEKYWKRELSQRSQRAKAYWSVLPKQPWFGLPQPRPSHPRV